MISAGIRDFAPVPCGLAMSVRMHRGRRAKGVARAAIAGEHKELTS